MLNTNAIADWVQTQTGLTTVWANQDLVQLDRPYCTIQINNVQKVGTSQILPPDNGIAPIYIQKEFIFSIQCYSEKFKGQDPRTSLDILSDLRDTLEFPTVNAELLTNGWAFLSVELLTDTTTNVNDRWEPRATFDVRFSTTAMRENDVGYVETVILNNESIGD